MNQPFKDECVLGVTVEEQIFLKWTWQEHGVYIMQTGLVRKRTMTAPWIFPEFFDC